MIRNLLSIETKRDELISFSPVFTSKMNEPQNWIEPFKNWIKLLAESTLEMNNLYFTMMPKQYSYVKKKVLGFLDPLAGELETLTDKTKEEIESDWSRFENWPSISNTQEYFVVIYKSLMEFIERIKYNDMNYYYTFYDFANDVPVKADSMSMRQNILVAYFFDEEITDTTQQYLFKKYRMGTYSRKFYVEFRKYVTMKNTKGFNIDQVEKILKDVDAVMELIKTNGLAFEGIKPADVTKAINKAKEERKTLEGILNFRKQKQMLLTE